MSKQYVITIGREFGSGGREIGEKLAARLGIPIYDKTILKKVAEEQDISDERLKKMDEYLNAHRFKNIGIAAQGFMPGLTKLDDTDASGYLDRDKVFAWQSDVIRRLADEGPCVIVGRCADYVLKDHPNLINVFIVAPMAAREERIKRLYPDHPRDHYETHRQYINKTDRLRAYYYNYHTGLEWGNMKNHDMILDSSKLGVERCVDLLEAYVRCRTE